MYRQQLIRFPVRRDRKMRAAVFRAHRENVAIQPGPGEKEPPPRAIQQDRIGFRARLAFAGLCMAIMLLGQLGALGAAAAEVQYPLALAVSDEGTIFLADRNLPGVWRVEQGEVELYFAGSKQFRTPLNAIRCLAIDRDGRLLAGDSATRQIYRFNDMGQPEPLARPLGALKLGPLGIPMAIAVNGQNEIFATDLEFHCIWKLGPQGGEPTKFAELEAPIGICVDEEDHVWAVSRLDGQLRRFAPDGEGAEIMVEGRPFDFPHNVALDSEGRAYVVDGYGRTVWRVTPGEEPEKWFTHDRLVNPVDIKRAGEQMLVVDPRAKAIFDVAPDGTATVIELEPSGN
jgi:hypothetical protein